MTHKQQYISGLKAGIPVMLGFVPVGIAYAIMAQRAGFSVWETAGMSAFVFAGASQMMAVGMYARGAGVPAMIVATFILNLRHMIMSACVMSRLKQDRVGVKLLAAFGVTDESFAVFMMESEEHASVWFFLGLFFGTYLSWVMGSVIGAVAVAFLPAVLSASLGIALYAMFLGLLVPGTAPWLVLATGLLGLRTKPLTGQMGTSACCAGVALLLFGLALPEVPRLLSAVIIIVFIIWAAYGLRKGPASPR